MINILPYNHKKAIDQLRTTRVVTITLWAFILLVVIAGLLLVPLLVTIDSRFSLANSQIKQLEKEGVVVSSVDVAALESRVKALSEKLAAPLAPAPSDYIKVVQSIATPGIALSGFAMEKGEVPRLDIAGTASSREALQRFIAALEASESVAMVESPVSNYVKSANSSFSIKVSFK